MHHQITNSNSAQTGHVQNVFPHTGRLKGTSLDTQLAGRNVRPQLSANFLHTGNATSVGITQSLHNQSTESVFLHTEGNIVCARSKERKSRERKVVKDNKEERMRSATLAKSNPKPELLDLNTVLVLHSTFNCCSNSLG
ncbi:hypothetical protein Tco_1295577 [Tanacetum coccineum]